MKSTNYVGHTPHTDTPILFKEEKRMEQQNGNDCGFIALNTTRQEVVDFILANLSREELRKLLLPELKMVCAIECSKALANRDVLASPNTLRIRELFSISEALVEAEELELVNQEINRLLASSRRKGLILIEHGDNSIIDLFSAYEAAHIKVQPMLNQSNELLGFKDGNRGNFDELANFFYQADQQLTADTLDHKFTRAKRAFQEAKAIIDIARTDLEAALITEEVVGSYVENYYREDNGWMAFQPAKSGGNNSSIIDVIAMMKKCQIVVWQNKEDGSKLQPLYMTLNYSEKGESYVQSHMKYDGSTVGHFTALNLSVRENPIIVTLESVGHILPRARNWPAPRTGLAGDEESDYQSPISTRRVRRNLAEEWAKEGQGDTFARVSYGSDTSETYSSDIDLGNNSSPNSTNRNEFPLHIILQRIERAILRAYLADKTEMVIELDASKVRREHLVGYCKAKLGISSSHVLTEDGVHQLLLSEASIDKLETLQNCCPLRMSI